MSSEKNRLNALNNHFTILKFVSEEKIYSDSYKYDEIIDVNPEVPIKLDYFNK
jgi:hypothetical protein